MKHYPLWLKHWKIKPFVKLQKITTTVPAQGTWAPLKVTNLPPRLWINFFWQRRDSRMQSLNAQLLFQHKGIHLIWPLNTPVDCTDRKCSQDVKKQAYLALSFEKWWTQNARLFKICKEPDHFTQVFSLKKVTRFTTHKQADFISSSSSCMSIDLKMQSNWELHSWKSKSTLTVGQKQLHPRS